jgi:hypothetical protein
VLSTVKNERSFVKDASKNPDFIPTDGNTDMTTDETTSQSTKPPKNGGKVTGYNPAKDAAKVFASSRYAACLLTPLPRLAFGRTLNF